MVNIILALYVLPAQLNVNDAHAIPKNMTSIYFSNYGYKKETFYKQKTFA